VAPAAASNPNEYSVGVGVNSTCEDAESTHRPDPLSNLLVMRETVRDSSVARPKEIEGQHEYTLGAAYGYRCTTFVRLSANRPRGSAFHLDHKEIVVDIGFSP
jgi:hypothetical protein